MKVWFAVISAMIFVSMNSTPDNNTGLMIFEIIALGLVFLGGMFYEEYEKNTLENELKELKKDVATLKEANLTLKKQVSTLNSIVKNN